MSVLSCNCFLSVLETSSISRKIATVSTSTASNNQSILSASASLSRAPPPISSLSSTNEISPTTLDHSYAIETWEFGGKF